MGRGVANQTIVTDAGGVGQADAGKGDIGPTRQAGDVA
jgi:hypothetical protein